jgi:hypothetical protein
VLDGVSLCLYKCLSLSQISANAIKRREKRTKGYNKVFDETLSFMAASKARIANMIIKLQLLQKTEYFGAKRLPNLSEETLKGFLESKVFTFQ